MLRTCLRTAFCAALWLLTVAAGLAEGSLLALWINRTRYLQQFGAAENPYVAEDAAMAGIFALCFIPLFLLFLICAICMTRYCMKKRRIQLENETSHNT